MMAVIAMSVVFPASAQEPVPQKDPSIAILFTNDVHSYYDRDIGYDGLMLYKKEMEQQSAVRKNVS